METMNSQEYYQHPNSPLRSRANLVGHIVQVNDGIEYKEQVWLSLMGDGSPKVATLLSAPFFAYGFALEDTVELDSSVTVTKVRIPSGRSLLRVFFSDASTASAIAIKLLEVGAGHLEWMNLRYLCLDCPDVAVLNSCWSLLEQHEDAGDLEFESASLATKDSS